MPAKQSDNEAVKTANTAYYRALSDRDMRAMERVWTRGADNILIAPPVNPVTHMGWAAITRNWEDYWSNFLEFSVSMEISAINIVGPVAWVHGVESSKRRTKTGQASSSTNFGTNIFVAQNHSWLMVFHQSVAMPGS
jgi:ketosteroid isomerase-like protein